MQTAPESPEPFARTDKSVPRQGHHHYRDNAPENQVTLRRVAPRPANPPLVPERHPPSKRNGPGGIRTLTRTLARNCAAIHHRHEPKLTSVTLTLRIPRMHLLKQGFVLGKTSHRWRIFLQSALKHLQCARPNHLSFHSLRCSLVTSFVPSSELSFENLRVQTRMNQVFENISTGRTELCCRRFQA